ncbi:MAG TPA: hypothetical protein VK549_03635 [Acidimicrobiia bacterium]|nr:hypothetical protein [Acidimicrobiia bacterium]
MEVRDDTVWDGATPFATLAPSADGAVSLQLLTPVVISREVARSLIAALTSAGVPALDVGDALLRDQARAVGWVGALRAPLVAPDGADAQLDPVGAVHSMLSGAEVERRGLSRRTLSMRVTTVDGLRMKVKVPDRSDVMPEMLAAALDTALAVRRRFGRMASGVHTISIDDGAGGFDDHRTAGAATSGTGTFFLDTSLACGGAMEAQRQRMAGAPGISAQVTRPWFSIDGVVAHEYWHNLDTTVLATPATYVELNRALGAELGVETFEHALRGREDTAPLEWRHALGRIVREVSPYATTNMREATAEMFKLWWCAPPHTSPSPLVACFGALLDRFYPSSA